MGSSTDLCEQRKKLRALGDELVELTETYKPSPPFAWDVENPVVTKAKAIITAAQTPVDYLATLCCTTVEVASVQTLLELNAIQSIPDEGINAQDLAQKTGVQESLLIRLFRLLTNSGFVLQDEKGNYSHSHLSAGFRYPGANMMLAQVYKDGLQPLIRLPQFLEEQRQTTGKVEEPGASRDNTFWNIFTWSCGEQGKHSTFEIMERDPVKMQAFQKNLERGAHLHPYTGYYDFSKLATKDEGRVVFVDVGGGHGYAIQNVLKAHSEIKPEQCVLQDSAPVVEYAEKENTDLPKGVKVQAHDFFQPNPVKGARAYYLRAIAHDLSDQNTIKVLKQITPVMEKDSKILIADNIIPDTVTSGMTAVMDMMMMAIGGKERTEQNFRDVADEAGLKVDGVWRAEGTTYAVIEASLK